MDVDRRPEWLGKPCKECKRSQQTQQAVKRNDECLHTGFNGKPDGMEAECNWRCELVGSCDAQCCRRSLQRGAPHRLQVFRSEMKGWCLRTLTPIKKDEFVMEYARAARPPRTSLRPWRLPPCGCVTARILGSSILSAALWALVRRYVAERISDERADERKKDNPDVETYLMDMQVTLTPP